MRMTRQSASRFSKKRSLRNTPRRAQRQSQSQRGRGRAASEEAARESSPVVSKASARPARSTKQSRMRNRRYLSERSNNTVRNPAEPSPSDPIPVYSEDTIRRHWKTCSKCSIKGQPNRHARGTAKRSLRTKISDGFEYSSSEELAMNGRLLLCITCSAATHEYNCMEKSRFLRDCYLNGEPATVFQCHACTRARTTDNFVPCYKCGEVRSIAGVRGLKDRPKTLSLNTSQSLMPTPTPAPISMSMSTSSPTPTPTPTPIPSPTPASGILDSSSPSLSSSSNPPSVPATSTADGGDIAPSHYTPQTNVTLNNGPPQDPRPLFRCNRCRRACHEDCLGDIPNQDTVARGIDTSANRKQLCREHWHCPECIGYGKPEKILGWRIKGLAREYLVKWADWSYGCCTWVPQDWISTASRQLWLKYEAYGESPVEDEAKVIPPEFKAIERILIAEDDEGDPVVIESMAEMSYVRRVYAVFEGLSYDEAAWDLPPARNSPYFPAYKRAFRTLIRSHGLEPPNPKAMERKIHMVRNGAQESPYALRELKQQPEFITNGQLMEHQMEGLKYVCGQRSNRTLAYLTCNVAGCSISGNKINRVF